MKTPLVSIVVLSYENVDKIFETLDSVISQDYPNFELIVSDDCSSRFPKDQIIDYLMNNNLPFKVRQNDKNLGTVAHCNHVAREVAGELIKLMACGDKFCDNSSLSALVKFAQMHPQAPVITSVSKICSRDFTTIYYEFPSPRRIRIINNKSPQELFETLVFSNIISAVGTLFRKQFFDDYQGFDSRYKFLEDWPTWLRLTRSGIAIPCCPTATVYYALGGISSQYSNAFESEKLRDDLILCYEQEILPYFNYLGQSIKVYSEYQYKKLKFFNNYSWTEKLAFSLRYAPFEIFKLGKKVLKRLITSKR